MRSIGIVIFLFIIINCLTSVSYAQPSFNISAENAILIERSSGDILYEKNAHEQQDIASITKIMTAIIAIESGQMDELAKTSRRAIYTEGSSIYLEQGEKMSIEDLLYGLMLRSGNDAAVVISEHIGGSVEGFVHLMNEKASWLGMTNSHFNNPHGLNDDEHYSTAYDMAILMRYAMNNSEFRKISRKKLHKAETKSYSWRNKNKLLRMYNHATGGKTGFTKLAGRTLVSSAAKDGVDLIAVTLNAPNDWEDHINLFEWGFNHIKTNNHLDTTTSLSVYNNAIRKNGSFLENIRSIYKKIIGMNDYD